MLKNGKGQLQFGPHFKVCCPLQCCAHLCCFGTYWKDNSLAFILQLICGDSKYLAVVGELFAFSI